MEISRDPRDYMPPSGLARIRARSLIIGIVALAIDCIVGLGILRDGTQFFRSYLLAWEFWNNVALGCLALLMMQHLTGGRWAFVIRRPLEAATRVLWLTALLGIPWLIWGIPRLYLWGNATARAHDEHLAHSVWLTAHGVVFRYCVYFAAWLALSIFLNKYSARQDRIADIIVKRRLENVSGPGLVIYLLTATFSSIDWLMSLDPHWGSTMYGFILIAGQALVAVCFMIAVLVILVKSPPMNSLVHPQQFHDLGKLVLTFLMLWAYFSFSQYLLVWAGNLPDEINWYLHRLHGNWWWVGLALILLHFALPFALLLSRDLKRAARPLVLLAAFVIVMRWVDLFWLVAPNPLPLRPHGTTFSWQDILLTLGIGGIWLALFFWELGKRPLVTLYDPWFEQVVEHAGKP
jgi:hypothetical protein